MPNDEQATAVLGRAIDLHEPQTEAHPIEAPLAMLNEIYRYALGRLGSKEDAEDATMEAYLAVHASPARWLRARDQRLYLFGIAARKIADVLRRRRRERPIPAGASGPAGDDLERRQVIEEVLGRLPEAQREVLVLKYSFEFSVNEIARIVRKSPQAVNSLLQRARDGFRDEAAGPLDEGMSR